MRDHINQAFEELRAALVIDLDVFDVQVAVYTDAAQRRDSLEAVGVKADEYPAGSWATAHKDIGQDGVAWFSMVIKPEASRATWAHECVHIADFVMDHLGMPTGVKNTEVRGYIVGHLFASLDAKLPEDYASNTETVQKLESLPERDRGADQSEPVTFGFELRVHGMETRTDAQRLLDKLIDKLMDEPNENLVSTSLVRKDP
jgi:hypothetical protein